MIKKYLPLIILLILSASLFSQSDPARGFESELQRLQQQIQMARDLLRLFPDQQAAEWVRQAEQLGEEARVLNANHNTRLAQLKSHQAFDAVNRAMSILSTIPAQRTREQVEDLFRRAEQIVPASRNQEAERLLNRAKEHLRLATDALNRGQSQRGMEYLRIAKTLVEQSLELVEKNTRGGGDTIETEKARFLDLLEKARAAVTSCHDPRAERLVQQAVRQAENVTPLYRRGENRLAISLYYNATRLLLRAIDLCSGSAGSEREQTIEENEMLDGLLSQASASISVNTDPRRNLILTKAIQLQQQARQAFASEQYGLALRKIELARALLSRMWSESIPSEGARQELSRLQDDLAKLAAETSLRENPKIERLLQAARQSVEDATRFLERDRTGMALISILAGNRFLTLARTLSPDHPFPDPQQLQSQINRLYERLELSTTTTTDDGQNDRLFTKRLLQRAEQSLSQQEYDLAVEYIRVVEELLNNQP